MSATILSIEAPVPEMMKLFRECNTKVLEARKVGSPKAIEMSGVLNSMRQRLVEASRSKGMTKEFV